MRESLGLQSNYQPSIVRFAAPSCVHRDSHMFHQTHMIILEDRLGKIKPATLLVSRLIRLISSDSSDLLRIKRQSAAQYMGVGRLRSADI